MVARQTISEVNFDSVFYPARPDRPAQLVIRLKVALLPRDPSKPSDIVNHQNVHLASHIGAVHRGGVRDHGGEGLAYRCRSWLVPEFNAFKIKFKRMVELSWNNQLILLPPDGSKPGDSQLSPADYGEFVSRQNVPAHVHCAIDIVLLPLGHTQSHIVMEVIKLEKPAAEQYPASGFRSNALLITDEDVDFKPSRRGLLQVTAAHEVGHWLGRPVELITAGSLNTDRLLRHIDWAVCSASPHYEAGGDCEYGRTLGRMKAIMGAGQLMTEYEAAPWLNRIRRHTKALFGWKIVHRVDFNNGRLP